MKWFLFFLLVSCAQTQHPSLITEYRKVMFEHQSVENMGTCADVDLKTNPRAWKFRNNIIRSNPDLSRPNYNGQYLLLESPMTGGSDWFITDCKTGKVLDGELVGHILFEKNSAVVLRNPPTDDETVETFTKTVYGYPEMYKWENGKWALLKNKIQPAND